MAFVVTWNGQNGSTTMKVRVSRKDDNLYWDETLASWVSTVTTPVAAMTESSAGVYTLTMAFIPGPGMTYQIEILNGTTPVITSYYSYPGEKRTALQHVNDVQAALRMPQSADFTSAHARLVLSNINTAIMLMLEAGAWPEMKCQGKLYTVAGKSLYQLRPANTPGAEIVERMQIGTAEPIEIITDDRFRSYSLLNTTQKQPVYARIYGRVGDALLLELAPTPDAVYAIDFDVLLKVPLLSVVTDIPVLDDAMVLLGGTAFAKKEQGEAFIDDMNIFQAKVQSQRDNISEPNWGDSVETP